MYLYLDKAFMVPLILREGYTTREAMFRCRDRVLSEMWKSKENFKSALLWCIREGDRKSIVSRWYDYLSHFFYFISIPLFRANVYPPRMQPVGLNYCNNPSTSDPIILDTAQGTCFCYEKLH